MTDYKNWTSRVYDAIRDISDLDFQRRAWLMNGKEVSSFVEIIDTLFDDNLFEEFLQDIHWNKVGLSNEVKLNMKELLGMLNDYITTEKSEEEIICDPQWLSIVEQAKKVVLLMKNNT